MQKLLLIILLTFLCFSVVSGQTEIPDSNFRDLLLKSNPNLFSKRQLLIDSLAQRFSGTIDCSGRNISNLAGLEKFTALTSFNCSYNNITSIDQIKNLTNLYSLSCSNNQIKTLPDLSGLSNLSYLKCSDNQLKDLPDLSNNISLNYLDCYNNQISFIPGLDMLINLNNLNIYNNKIDSLPDLSNLNKLVEFQCFGNHLASISGLSSMVSLNNFSAGGNPLKKLPDMSKLTRLEILMCWSCQLEQPPVTSGMRNLNVLNLNGNGLKSLPDLSKNVSLDELRCMDNQIDTIIGLKYLVYLDKIYVSRNNIRSLSDISAAQNSLREFVASGNQLQDLPNFSNFHGLVNVQVENNFLTFNDLLGFPAFSRPINFSYVPQADIAIADSFAGIEHNPYTIKISCKQYAMGNLYSWFKNGSLLSQGTVDSLFFPSLSSEDSGVYFFTISNNFLPGLILKSNTQKLSFTSCINVANIKYSTEDINCERGGSVVVDETTIKGGKTPYVYTLQSTLLGSKLNGQGNKFIGLNEKSYVLKIADQNGCHEEVPVALKGKSIADCKNLVIVAGQQQSNDLLLEQVGTAKVYDKSGRLVHSFNTPASWDGTLSDGSTLPGQYLIELNGESFNVTVLR